MRKSFSLALSAVSALSLSALVGCSGDNGSAGANGEGCTLVDNGDGTKTVTCGADSVIVGPGEPGTTGTNGDDGAPGTDGRDGTDCTAVDNGDSTFTITCGEDSVVVRNGNDGANGTDGTDGTNGTDGVNGIDGVAGADGVNGADGVAGLDGTNGVDGLNGTNGTDGIDGVDGANGQDGADGLDGTSCTVVANGNGTYTLTCGAESVTVADGADAPIPVTPGPVTAIVDGFTVSGGFATIDFSVYDVNGDPMPGLAVPGSNATRSLYFRLGYAQLAAGAIPSDPNVWAPLTSGDRNLVSLLDNGDGTYAYLSTTDIAATYDASRLTRVLLLVAVGPAVTEPYNTTTDFPGSGAALTRDIVTNTACSSCHGKLEGRNFPMHGGGSRYAIEACTVCHVTTLGGGEAYFPTMIHKIHSAESFDLGDYSTLTYPQVTNNCATCHSGADAYWNTKPSRAACAACHTTITFDNTPYTGIKGVAGAGVLHDNPPAATCSLCHNPGAIAEQHALASSNDLAQRTMSATITGVVINDGEAGETNGGTVVVSFTMDNAGVPVTDRATFGTVSFLLSKLMPGTDGASSHWQSYVNRFRTKNAQPMVSQGTSESSTTGVLTNVGGGLWTYRFGLPEADVDGDIRTINNARDNTVGYATLYPFPVAYEPALTHRVAMAFSTAAPANIPNKTNATFDFVPVPNAAAPAVTRDLVNMDKCRSCHADQRLHSGYDVKYCVNCHNQGTFDPYTGDNPMTVDLQRLVHKVHMGRNLPSVLAGGSYTVNSLPGGAHDFSSVSFPRAASDCLACHDESLANGADWRNKPTSRACGTCHDGEAALLHIEQNSVGGQTCAVCHGPGRLAPVLEAHDGIE